MARHRGSALPMGSRGDACCATTRPRQVAYLVHDAGRTGAPVALIRLVREMSAAGYAEPRFVIRRPGELVRTFEELGPVLIAEETRMLRTIRNAPKARGAWAAGTPRRYALRRFLRGADILYSNTMVNGDLLSEIGRLDVPMVTHAHELHRYLSEWTTHEAAVRVCRGTSAWISVSDAVTDMLVDRWRVPRHRVFLVRECVDDTFLHHVRDRARGSNQLEVSDEALVIGCAGSLDGRKGVDLFPILAKVMLNERSDRSLAFRWLGGEEGSPEQEFAREEVRLAGLSEHVRFIAGLADPRDALARFDVLVVLSREDPYPLVAIEAAALGRPIVCFSDAGGAPELARRGAGIVAPYLDLESVSRATLALIEEGPRARESACRALGAEHNAATAAAAVAAVLEGVLRSR